MIAEVHMAVGEYAGICIGIFIAGFLAGLRLSDRERLRELEERKGKGKW